MGDAPQRAVAGGGTLKGPLLRAVCGWGDVAHVGPTYPDFVYFFIGATLPAMSKCLPLTLTLSPF
ncbi:UNVERIFIED_ORG: hypothetical protein GGI66_005007 [Rhizobium esperanzae]